MSLHEINIQVLDTRGNTSLLGSIQPILREIETLLARLVETERGGAIDLRSLPMSPDDYQKLKEVLGEGEVGATLDAMGPTQVRETSIHGVWWVTHHNSDETIVAEFIEVTVMPEILLTHPADARVGLDKLRSRINQSTEIEKGDADA